MKIDETVDDFLSEVFFSFKHMLRDDHKHYRTGASSFLIVDRREFQQDISSQVHVNTFHQIMKSPSQILTVYSLGHETKLKFDRIDNFTDMIVKAVSTSSNGKGWNRWRSTVNAEYVL